MGSEDKKSSWVERLKAQPAGHTPEYTQAWADHHNATTSMKRGPAPCLSEQEMVELIDTMNDGSQALTR